MNEARSSDGSESRRLAILRSYSLESADLAGRLDRLAALAAKLCDAPVGLVSLVEADRQRFIGRCGTDLAETPREHAFCDLAMQTDDGMVVADASTDSRFRDNPLVTETPGIRFYAAQPLRSPEGAPLGTICVIDTVAREGLSDDQRFGLQTLAESAMALFERQRIENSSRNQAARSKSAIHDLEQRFQVLTDAMPQLVWSTRPSGRADYFNRRWCDYTGASAEASYGDSWMAFLHPDDCAPVEQVWKEAVASEGIYEVEYRLRRSDGDYRWMLARGLPMRDQAGRISRWIGTCTDIQEQKATADQQELLTRELSHRIKNIFAVLGGLITLSQRQHPEMREYGGALQQRVLALGRAHDFVRPHSDPSRSHISHNSLHGMLGSLLEAYQARPASACG